MDKMNIDKMTEEASNHNNLNQNEPKKESDNQIKKKKVFIQEVNDDDKDLKIDQISLNKDKNESKVININVDNQLKTNKNETNKRELDQIKTE